MRRFLIAAVATAALAAPSGAGATTFCIDAAAGCTGTNVPQANAESQALQKMPDRSDGAADLVVFPAGEFFNTDDWVATGNDALEIRGAGHAATVLTTSSTANLNVLRTDSVNNVVTVRDLAVRVPSGVPSNQGGAALCLGDVFERVDFLVANDRGNGATSFSGCTFRDGTIDGDGTGKVGTGLRPNTSQAGTITIERASIRAGTPVIDAYGPAPMTVRESVLDSNGSVAVTADNGGDITLVNSIVRSLGIYPFSVYAGLTPSEDTKVIANHVTIVQNPPSGNYPVARVVVDTNDDGDAELTVRNSIADGFPTAYQREAPFNDLSRGNAYVIFGHSDFHLGASTSTGDGTVTVSDGNIDADPLFVSPTDLHLQSGSPAIDVGEPGTAGTTIDLDGSSRVDDGNGDGIAVRDMGAFEYHVPPPPPPPDGTAPPGSVAPPFTPPIVVPRPLPTFGARTLVALAGLGVDGKGRAILTVKNANTFPITGTVVVNSVRAVATASARVGRKAFAVGPGTTKTVRVKLSKKARRTLRRRGRLPARLVATVRAPSGATRKTTKRVTLRRRAARRG